MTDENKALFKALILAEDNDEEWPKIILKRRTCSGQMSRTTKKKNPQHRATNFSHSGVRAKFLEKYTPSLKITLHISPT